MLEEFAPVAAALDKAHQTSDYVDALRAAQALMQGPELLPSARVLATMKSDFAASYTGFIRAQSAQTQQLLLALPWSAEQHSAFEAMARESVAKRCSIEATDSEDFETFRQAYLAPQRLLVWGDRAAAATLKQRVFKGSVRVSCGRCQAPTAKASSDAGLAPDCAFRSSARNHPR